MKTKLKKSYRFALRSSGIISFCVLGLLLLFRFLDLSNFWHILLFIASIFVISFIVLQYRVERFIYRGVKKIYDDVSLLESTSFQDQSVTTNMQTLKEEIEKFAKNKKVEIEALKIREGYRKEFLGNISHELKTPLFTVQGYILTLLDGAMEDKNIRKKYLGRASKGVERLIYIVRDLDMITRLEAGDLNLELEDFDIIELIQGVFDMMEMKAHKKDITLTFDTFYEQPIMVYADRERIQQVVSNLVVNSVKYSKESSTTEVSIEDLVKNKVIVRVTDNGEGIENQNIPRLFERFYRIDKSGSRKEGGSGLGLAIVKHIIEAHKEKIYVESVYGVGSEFSFTLEKTKERTKV